MMNLQEQFDEACADVNRLIGESNALIEARADAADALQEAEQELAGHEEKIRQAAKGRDNIRAMMSVTPPPKTVSPVETRMEEKQAVFVALRQMPGTWIMPAGLAVLSGVDDSVTAAILRRAASLDGIPVEHNGKRGRASMYRWVGK